MERARVKLRIAAPHATDSSIWLIVRPQDRMLRPTCTAFLVALLAACRGASATSPRSPVPAAAVPSTPSAARAQAEPELVAIDMFGTQRITREQLLTRYGSRLRAFGEAVMRRDRHVDTEAILTEIGKLGDFAEVSPALVGYYEPGGMKHYLTLDFVDSADAVRRMPFVPEPTGTFTDPEGLLADWYVYESKVFELTGSNQMSLKRVSCPESRAC